MEPRPHTLVVTSMCGPDGWHVTATGDLDIESAPILSDSCAVVDADIPDLSIHAGGLTFVDSSGLRAILHALSHTLRVGGRFRLVDPSPHLRRLAAITGLEERLGLVETVAIEPPPAPTD